MSKWASAKVQREKEKLEKQIKMKERKEFQIKENNAKAIKRNSGLKRKSTSSAGASMDFLDFLIVNMWN